MAQYKHKDAERMARVVMNLSEDFKSMADEMVGARDLRFCDRALLAAVRACFVVNEVMNGYEV